MPETHDAPRAEILRTRDFIGWTVFDARGSKVGTVSDLLIDRRGQVRFLAIDPGLFRKAFLLPAPALEWGEDSLVLVGWSADEVKTLPPYDPARALSAEVLAEMASAHPRFYAGEDHPAFPPRGEDERIVPLREAKGFRIPKGTVNPQGWTVFGADGERAGTVAGLMVDPVAMKVSHLDVDLSDDLFLLDDDRHVAIPAEHVDLRERGQDVWVARLSAAALAHLPAYTGGALDPLVQARVDEAFAAAPDAPALPSGTSAPALPPPLPDGAGRHEESPELTPVDEPAPEGEPPPR